MVLQHIIFPSTQICTEEQMYFRRNDAVIYQWTEDAIFLSHSGAVSFDTYFNGFSAEKWFKYTSLERVFISIKIKGIFRITLMQKQKRTDGVETRFLSEHICGKSGEQGEYSFEFNPQSNSGMLCFSLLAIEDGCTFFGGEYTGRAEEKFQNKVKLGAVICTFKREKMITANILRIREKLLENDKSELFSRLEIFIADNGRTLEKSGLYSDKIKLFHNKNAGGAGGFTRGIIEVLKANTAASNSDKITHVILMDDDIILDTEVLFTTYSLLCILKEEYKAAFIGGAMLRLDRQYFQTEAGAVWNGGSIASLKSGLDLRQCETCLFNEIEEKTDYNAWWYCTMPIDQIVEQNLPLPMFIRGDDIEYGLRNMKHLILLNRICVWHEPFENKYSSAIFYYIYRNMLINNALHVNKFKRYELIKRLLVSVSREVAFYRFKNAELILRGVRDFYRGTAWLKAQDGEKLHSELTKSGYSLEYIERLEMPFSYHHYEMSQNQKSGGFFGRIFRIVSFNGLLLPAKKETTASVSEPRPINFFRVKRALNYDFNSKKGFVTKKCIKSTFSCLWGLAKISLKIIFCSKKAASEYKNNSGELMKIDFWNEYLGL